MDISNVFSQLGLKEDHLKIYLANLEWGETTVSNLAYKAKLPRTSVYSYLEELIDLGLIKGVLRKGKRQYAPAEPEYLITLLQKQKVDVENLIIKMENSMTQLKSIQNNRDDKPKVHYLEGAEGIKQAYELSLKAKKEVLVQCYSGNYAEIVGEEFFDDYFPKFFKLDVKSREMIGNSKADEDYAKKWGSKKNLQALVDTSNVSNEIETDVMIFDGKVIFVAYDLKNPYALVVEDKSIFDAMKSMYELAWSNAVKNDRRVKAGEKVRVEYEA